LLLHVLGLKVNDIQELDYWQFYGYQKVLNELVKIYYLFEGHIKRITRLLFVISTSPWIGLKDTSIEKFFEFEELLQASSGEKKEKIDPLEGKGEWIEKKDGTKEWVYNYEGLQDIRNFLDKFNGRRGI